MSPSGSVTPSPSPRTSEATLPCRTRASAAGQEDREVLEGGGRPDAQHLAAEELERRRRVEDDLHDTRGLLLDDAHRDPVAVEHDHHEDQDRHPEREQVRRAHLGRVLRRLRPRGSGHLTRRPPGRRAPPDRPARRRGGRAGRRPRPGRSLVDELGRAPCRSVVRVEREREFAVGPRSIARTAFVRPSVTSERAAARSVDVVMMTASWVDGAAPARPGRRRRVQQGPKRRDRIGAEVRRADVDGDPLRSRSRRCTGR